MHGGKDGSMDRALASCVAHCYRDTLTTYPCHAPPLLPQHNALTLLAAKAKAS